MPGTDVPVRIFMAPRRPSIVGRRLSPIVTPGFLGFPSAQQGSCEDLAPDLGFSFQLGSFFDENCGEPPVD